MLAVIALLLARFPTYKYFVIPEGYTEADIHEPAVQSAFEFASVLVPKFLDEFSGPHPVTLIHAWNKTSNGEFYALEVLRLRVRYLLTIQSPSEGKFYLHSVRILNEETESGMHWFHPPEDILNLCLDAARQQFGTDLSLINVAVYKTLMMGKTVGQMVIDAETANERMLIDIRLLKKFGEKQFKVSNITRVY